MSILIFRNFLPKFVLQYPIWALCFKKHFLILQCHSKDGDVLISESVSLILIEKSGSFTEYKDNATLITVYKHISSIYCSSVWGIVYLYSGFVRTSCQIKQGSTLEPNNILYLSDYQIIHSILVVIWYRKVPAIYKFF